MNIAPISKPAAEILRQSQFIVAGDVGVNVPPGVTVSAEVQSEIQIFLRVIQIPVREAAHSVLAALLEQHGVQLDPNLSAIQ